MDDVALHPLDGPRAKVTRAMQHARSLSEQCQAYTDSHPVTLSCRWEEGAYIAYLEGQVPPVYLGLIFGDVVHNLRSALDQLAWSLAWTHSRDALEDERVARAIFFPISSSQERFRNHRAVQYFPPDAAEQMESEQPYRNATEQLHPLAAVQSWSNHDKHRALTVALAQVSADDLALETDVPIDVNEIEPLVEPSTLVDPARGFMRIPVPQSAHIRFQPIAVPVGVPTFAVEPPQVIGTWMVEELCAMFAKCVDSYERFFEAVDWRPRHTEWISPNLPSPYPSQEGN